MAENRGDMKDWANSEETGRIDKAGSSWSSVGKEGRRRKGLTGAYCLASSDEESGRMISGKTRL